MKKIKKLEYINTGCFAGVALDREPNISELMDKINELVEENNIEFANRLYEDGLEDMAPEEEEKEKKKFAGLDIPPIIVGYCACKWCIQRRFAAGQMTATEAHILSDHYATPRCKECGKFHSKSNACETLPLEEELPSGKTFQEVINSPKIKNMIEEAEANIERDMDKVEQEPVQEPVQEDWIDKAFEYYRETRLPHIDDKKEECRILMREAINKYIFQEFQKVQEPVQETEPKRDWIDMANDWYEDTLSEAAGDESGSNPKKTFRKAIERYLSQPTQDILQPLDAEKVAKEIAHFRGGLPMYDQVYEFSYEILKKYGRTPPPKQEASITRLRLDICEFFNDCIRVSLRPGENMFNKPYEEIAKELEQLLSTHYIRQPEQKKFTIAQLGERIDNHGLDVVGFLRQNNLLQE